MSNWIHIASFSFPDKMGVVRSLLESNGINCVSQNDMTIEYYTFMPTTAGGIKLIVSKDDYEEAVKIMEEGGYGDFILPLEQPFITWLRKSTDQIGFLKHKSVVVRFYLLMGIVTILLSVAFFLVHHFG
ncbi:MAG: DUF2007 domain-containing protein [Chitinophagales bacterium]